MLPAADLGLIVAIAAGVAVLATGIGLLVLHRGRGRSLTGQLVVVVLALTASTVGSTAAVAWAMLLSSHDLVVTLWVTAVSGVVALLAAALLGRSFMRSARLLVESARAVGTGATIPAPVSRTSELAALGRELASTSERLAEARHDAERAEASRRELVAWVSHDLRTPLASVRAMAEALEDGLVDDPARYHRGIRTQIDHVSALVDDLFELSRLNAGQLPPQRAPVSAYDLVSDAIADLGPAAQERHVAITAHGDLEATLVLDQGQLVRALENLLANALRVSPPGAEVVVAVRRLPDHVELSVTDHGGGLRPADLPRLFDAGWRGDAARPVASGSLIPAGAGLGLAIVKSIVEGHGGTVGAANVGDGSRFVLTLPDAWTSQPAPEAMPVR